MVTLETNRGIRETLHLTSRITTMAPCPVQHRSSAGESNKKILRERETENKKKSRSRRRARKKPRSFSQPSKPAIIHIGRGWRWSHQHPRLPASPAGRTQLLELCHTPTTCIHLQCQTRLATAALAASVAIGSPSAMISIRDCRLR